MSDIETGILTGLDATVARVRDSLRSLQRWLADDAYPLWARQGYDDVHGGFHETLGSDGPVANEPRRARVQLRQIYSFARAADLGWRENACGLVTGGLDYFFAHYRRSDGLFRTLVAPNGTGLDDSALLYDQAFVLLALAESQKISGSDPKLVQAAQALRSRLYEHLKRPGPGFSSGVPDALPLLANPHMHLLEAALSWTTVSDEPAWRALADEIGHLALERLIDSRTGALHERFAESWTPLSSPAQRIVEPGHHFEWAWLLLRWGNRPDTAVLNAATRLVEIGETHGVRQGVAVNALLEDFAVHDGAARLWPQTERVKVAVRLAMLTGDPRYWSMTERATEGLRRYLDTEVPGLWFDRLTVDGQFVRERSPASSFYHIVGAIGELASALAER
ncbi:MAG: mannose-6-phosphate isomerase [Gammaproteobacteria bacterium]|nr:mannose-6-phosphate isomerase [Gammaproteobacteria bacterium]